MDLKEVQLRKLAYIAQSEFYEARAHCFNLKQGEENHQLHQACVLAAGQYADALEELLKYVTGQAFRPDEENSTKWANTMLNVVKTHQELHTGRLR